MGARPPMAAWIAAKGATSMIRVAKTLFLVILKIFIDTTLLVS